MLYMVDRTIYFKTDVSDLQIKYTINFYKIIAFRHNVERIILKILFDRLVIKLILKQNNKCRPFTYHIRNSTG